MKRSSGRTIILGLAPVAAAVLIAGCGQHASDQAAVQASAESGVGAEKTTTAAVATTSATPETQAIPTASSRAALPPEIDASADQDLVRPGEVVDVTAQGSSDVVRMTLQDRLGQREPMVFDSSANQWRASYRVPLKPAVERIALSVTAENGSNHWRRVWVFIKTQPDSASVPADSASAQ